MIKILEAETINYQKVLLDFIDSNKEDVIQMLEDNLYVYCYSDGEISIPYTDLPGITNEIQAKKLFPEVVGFIGKYEDIIKKCWNDNFKNGPQLNDFDSDKLLDIIYCITETTEFSNYVSDLFDDDMDAIAQYAEEEFDYDVHVKGYIHLSRQNYDGDYNEYINPSVIDYYRPEEY